MRPKWTLSLLVGALVALSGCSKDKPSAKPPTPDVIASFDGGTITKARYQEKFDSLMPCCKERYQGVDGTKRLIKEMVLPEVISRAIKSKKIDLRANIREKLGSLTDELNTSFLHMKFHEQILANNEKYKDMRQQYEFQKRQLEGYPLSERYTRLVQIHQKLHPEIAEEVEKVSRDYISKLRKDASITKNYDILRVKVTEEELKDFYRRHREGLHGDEYRVSERVKVREIRIKAIEGKESEARERAESALSELRSGAAFGAVAQSYGEAPHTSVRWIIKGENTEGFERKVFALDIGETSEVIENGSTFHILKVIEREPERFKAYEEAVEPLTKEYQWQKAEAYLKDNRDRILFTINGKPYTIGDFSAEYTRTIPQHECHHAKGTEMVGDNNGSPQLCDLSHMEFEEMEKLVDRMIDRELIIEDTYNRMIHVEHQKEIQFLTMASLYPIFHKEEMAKLIRITDEMVEDYYEKHKEEYRYPAKAKLNMILIQGGETEEKRKWAYEKAMKVYKELKPSFFSFKKALDFSEAARKYSEDPNTASKGGRIDVDVYECRNAVEYMLLHGFHKKIFSLEPGEISDVFEFQGDYYIIQVRELEARKQATFDEIREQAKQDIMDEKHQQVMENWEDNLLKSYGFAIYEKNIKQWLEAENSSGTDS